MTIWRKAWSLLDRRERRNALLVLAVIVVAGLASAVMVAAILPFLSVISDPTRIQATPKLAWAYAHFGFTSPYSFAVALGAGAVVVIVLASAVQILRVYVVTRFAVMRMHSLAHRLLHGYLGQPYEFFLSKHSGEMGTHILSETQEAVNQFLRPATNAVASLFSILAIVALLMWIDPLVTITTFVLLGSVYGMTLALSRRTLNRVGKARVEANNTRFRIAGEALGGIKDIKILGREQSYLRRFTQASLRMSRAHVMAILLAEIPSYVLQGLAFTGIVILVLLLVEPANLDGGAAVADIVPLLGVFAFAAQRLIPELQRLLHSLTHMHFGRATIAAVYRDVEASKRGEDFPAHAPAPLRMRQSIRFDAVSYRYPTDPTKGLSDITFEIQSGERIGIVGTTGAGKSTFADVVLGLMHPVSGRILVDGTEVTSQNVRAWREAVGYVPQNIFLVDASIRENIALGQPPEVIDEARIRAACRIANMDRFIETDLPQGYDTIVGERGVRLSGGQRQRVGIARAIYRNPDFIVFDEATSALDNVTETDVMTAIDDLPAGTTVMMIAHRLGTVRRCDRIAIFDRGRLVGIGGWDELLATSAIFRKMTQEEKAA